MSGQGDGPECDTCGKTACPDAQLPAFSEPRDCAFKAIYEAIKESKDCDYGCSRDYTNQSVALWMVPAIEALLAAARAEGAEKARAEVRERVEAVLSKSFNLTPQQNLTPTAQIHAVYVDDVRAALGPKSAHAPTWADAYDSDQMLEVCGFCGENWPCALAGGERDE